MYTNQKLLDYHRQNQDIKNTVVGEYLIEKVKVFYQANGILVNHLIKTLTDLEKEYFVHDDKGELQFEGEGRDRHPKGIFGMDPQEYTERRKKILAIPCNIKFKLK